MFPVHPTNNKTTLSKSSSLVTQHGRKLSHVQFGKRSFVQDNYASSTLMIPFDEMKQKVTIDSTIYMASGNNRSMISHESDIEGGAEKSSNQSSSLLSTTTRIKRRRRLFNWLFSSVNIGPFTQQDHPYWPLFTYLIVAFTIVIFSGELLLSKQTSGEFFKLEPFNYMLGPSMEIMIQAGARFPPCMRQVDSMSPINQRYMCLHNTLPPLDHIIINDDPRLFNSTSCSLANMCGMTMFYRNGVPDQTYRLLTPLFIHTGLVHLCMNMVVLAMLGVKVERAINSLRFSLLYIGSGIFGHALGANISPPTTPFLGCSSSIFGLIGYLHVDLIVNWKVLEQPVFYLIKLLLCTVLSLTLGLLPGVDTFSHMGGLIAGFILGLFLIPVKSWQSSSSSSTINTTTATMTKKKWIINMTRTTSIVIYSVMLGILIHQFSTVGNLDQVCPYCKYISCLPINGFCY